MDKINNVMLDIVCVLIGICVIPILGIAAIVLWSLFIGLVLS
jgi:hypothetical protein